VSVRGESSKDSINVFYEMVTALSGDQPPVVMVIFGHPDVLIVVLKIEYFNLCIYSFFISSQTHKDHHFIHVRQGGLYWVASTKTNPSPFTIIEFLNR